MDLGLFDSKDHILKNYRVLNFNFIPCYESSVMRTRNNKKGENRVPRYRFLFTGHTFPSPSLSPPPKKKGFLPSISTNFEGVPC